jgi:predicted transcriptional regulator
MPNGRKDPLVPYFSSHEFRMFILKILLVRGGGTRNGIVTFISEVWKEECKRVLNEMLEEGLIKQVRADALYELTEKGRILCEPPRSREKSSSKRENHSEIDYYRRNDIY